MRFDRVGLESIGYMLPTESWTSEDVERKLSPLYERLGMHYGRLEMMTGIGARRFWDYPILPSEASAMASEEVLKKSRFDRKDFDLLIHSAVCRDQLEPSTASCVHRRLGMGPGTQVFDISNACLGFLNAMIIAGSAIQSGQVSRALIVSGENGRPLLENTIEQLLQPGLDRKSIKPYFANLTIGAGAVAAVLCDRSLIADDIPSFLGGIVETDSSASELCVGDTAYGDSLQMLTDSEAMLEAGIALCGRAWKQFKSETGWDESTPEHVICHQVGKVHQRKLFDELNLDLDKDFSTYETLGNMGSVSVPLTLAMAAEQNVVKPGDKVALLGIGSGLSSLMLAMQW